MDCGIVDSTVGAGIEDADFVFYVSAMETERCHKGLTVAYAAHCQQEAALDRWIQYFVSYQLFVKAINILSFGIDLQFYYVIMFLYTLKIN